MADQFSIQRRLDSASEDLSERMQARRAAAIEAERVRAKRLIRLRVGVYFDPVTREVLRKVGSQYVFLRHDRRRTTRTGGRGEAVTLKPIQGGLYWDPKEFRVYQFRNGHYVLYSKDRRKLRPGKSPTGADRRKHA
jgi:hypothetical protein